MNLALLAALGTGLLVFFSRKKAPTPASPAEPKPSGPSTSPSVPKPEAPPFTQQPSGPTTPASVGADDGISWAKSLPKKPSQAREDAIFAAVQAGKARIEWANVATEAKGFRGTVRVFARTLRIGATNPVRVSVNFQTAQKICDLLGCAMMTPKVADLTRLQSVNALSAMPMSKWVQDGTMANTDRMIEYSLKLDGKLPVGDTSLTSNEGKHWVNTKRFWTETYNPPRSANYGWWSKDASSQGKIGPMWQTVGLVHNWQHVDYSQQVVLMSQTMLVEGLGEVHVGSVLKHPDLCYLLNYDGPLPSWGHPAFNLPATPDLDISAV